jgi:DNA-binding NarL/FixJ family response regulator
VSRTGGRVLIIEDHELLADALAVTLGVEGMDVAIADISDRDALLAEIDRNPPRLTLLDLDLGPPVGDGTQLIPHLLATGSAVLVVTGLRDRVRIATAIEAGAVGYLPKTQPIERLVAATRNAAAGRPVLPDAERHELLVLLDDHRRRCQQQEAPFERLSRREREVLAALADGGSIDSIAAASSVERSTVKTQIHAILTKLGVGSQIEAVAMARKAGWLSGDTAEWTPHQRDRLHPGGG